LVAVIAVRIYSGDQNMSTFRADQRETEIAFEIESHRSAVSRLHTRRRRTVRSSIRERTSPSEYLDFRLVTAIVSSRLCSPECFFAAPPLPHAARQVHKSPAFGGSSLKRHAAFDRSPTFDLTPIPRHSKHGRACRLYSGRHNILI